jgi:uncharacterized membrane protein YqjE
MPAAPPAAPGFVGALRALGETLLAAARERLELFALEVQEEKFRLIQTLVWICAVMFTGMMALIFASLVLVVCYWDHARLGVLVGLTVFYTTALGLILIAFRRFVARQPLPFNASRREMAEDRACIRSES